MREKNLGLNLWGQVVSAPQGRQCTPSDGRSHIFYWVEEITAFNLGGISVFYRVRKKGWQHIRQQQSASPSKNPGFAYGLTVSHISAQPCDV